MRTRHRKRSRSLEGANGNITPVQIVKQCVLNGRTDTSLFVLDMLLAEPPSHSLKFALLLQHFSLVLYINRAP